jgi:hypothetical protein
VPASRSSAVAFVLVAVVAGLLPVGASAFPLRSLAPAPSLSADSDLIAAVREKVATAGIYDVSVSVAGDSGASRFVNVKVGPVDRWVRIDTREHRASVTLRLAIKRLGFTVRIAPAAPQMPVRVTLQRVGSATQGAAAHTVATAPGKVSTRASGTVGKAAQNTPAASTPPAGPTGPTGASGPAGSTSSTGSTGSSGSSGSSGSTVAPPLAPTFAPDGAPLLALPAGFDPVANYTNSVEDYEFDGAALPSSWSPGNSAYGFEATEFEPSQVTMTGSSVALTATAHTSPHGLPYESGWISTEGAFTLSRGLIDFRAKVPTGQGLWSGLWMVNPAGSSPQAEIDVQEMLLNDTGTVNASLHNWGPTPYWAETQYVRTGVDLSAEFHDYQVEWQPGMLTWAIDGVAYAQYTEAEATAAGDAWPFDGTNMYLIADLAVGSADEWSGAPNASTQFPASMQIQSVKVWQ